MAEPIRYGVRVRRPDGDPADLAAMMAPIVGCSVEELIDAFSVGAFVLGDLAPAEARQFVNLFRTLGAEALVVRAENVEALQAEAWIPVGTDVLPPSEASAEPTLSLGPGPAAARELTATLVPPTGLSSRRSPLSSTQPFDPRALRAALESRAKEALNARKALQQTLPFEARGVREAVARRRPSAAPRTVAFEPSELEPERPKRTTEPGLARPPVNSVAGRTEPALTPIRGLRVSDEPRPAAMETTVGFARPLFSTSDEELPDPFSPATHEEAAQEEDDPFAPGTSPTLMDGDLKPVDLNTDERPLPDGTCPDLSADPGLFERALARSTEPLLETPPARRHPAVAQLREVERTRSQGSVEAGPLVFELSAPRPEVTETGRMSTPLRLISGEHALSGEPVVIEVPDIEAPKAGRVVQIAGPTTLPAMPSPRPERIERRSPKTPAPQAIPERRRSRSGSFQVFRADGTLTVLAPPRPNRGLDRRPNPSHRPAQAALLSLVLPGMGQVYNGQRERGVTFALGALLVLPWLWSIFDAAWVALQIRRGGRPLPPPAPSGTYVGQLALNLSMILGVVVALFLWSRIELSAEQPTSQSDAGLP